MDYGVQLLWLKRFASKPMPRNNYLKRYIIFTNEVKIRSILIYQIIVKE